MPSRPCGCPGSSSSGPTRSSILKEGEDVILSPRPQDWGPYLDGAPAASEAFMEGVEDLPVQEREG